MVVVTRRLRTVVAPTTKTEYADFPESPILPSSYGVAGRPLEDDAKEQRVFQESNQDPTLTFFKPFTKSPVKTVTHSHVQSATAQSILPWIIVLATGIFLGITIYLLSQKIPYYQTTVSPVPASGIFQKLSSRTPENFSKLPSLQLVNSSNLNLTPALPFTSR